MTEGPTALDVYKAALNRLRSEFEAAQDAWIVKMVKLHGPNAETVPIKLARGSAGSKTRQMWRRMESARVELEEFVRAHGDPTFTLEAKRYAPAEVVEAGNHKNGG